MVNKYGDKIPFEKTFNKIIKKLIWMIEYLLLGILVLLP